MKTSTKIVIAAFAAAMLLQAGLLINTMAQYKRVKPKVEDVAAQLEKADIRVVYLEAANRHMPRNYYVPVVNEGQFRKPKVLQTGKAGLQALRISGDTLFLSGKLSYDADLFFYSRDIEKVVVRWNGEEIYGKDYGEERETQKAATAE